MNVRLFGMFIGRQGTVVVHLLLLKSDWINKHRVPIGVHRPSAKDHIKTSREDAALDRYSSLASNGRSD